MANVRRRRPDESVERALDLAASVALGDVGGAPIAPPSTAVALAWDEDALHVRFDCVAEPPLSIAARRANEAVYEDECVEIFLAEPEETSRYRELVVNPRGATYGARLFNPDDSRETWQLERGVLPEGLDVEIRGEPDAEPGMWTAWRCRLRWPWRSASRAGAPPLSGETRRGNLYRIARGRETRYEALAPTGRAAPPDFHVPSRFATFAF